MFYKYPKSLDTDEQYKALSFEAKFLYMHLLSLYELSEKNGWIDGDAKTFVICTRTTMANMIGVSTRTATRLLKSLSDVGLVEVKKQRYGNSPKLYVKNLLSTNERYRNKADTKLSYFGEDEISRAFYAQYINS